MLTAVRVPSPAGEEVRALVRGRGDLMDDRKRMQQRLSAFLLRHGRTWSSGTKRAIARRLRADRQRFEEEALQEALDSYRAGREPLAPAVARLVRAGNLIRVTR